MFSKKKQPPIKSLIAEGSQIVGDIIFSDGLRIDGQVDGNLVAKENAVSMLVISESGVITGKVFAEHVVVSGTVHGPVHARQMLELHPKARIEGDVHYAALEMHQGALITGQLIPLHGNDEKPTLKLAANNP